MNPAVKRGIDLLAYGVSGAALAGAVLYGVQHLGSTAAPHAPAATAGVTVPPPTAAATAEAAAPQIAAPDAVAASTPAEPAAPPPSTATLANVAVPPPQPAISAQDKSAFFSLQRNCYDAAANNQNGEYPAMQAAACNRYLQFANEHGWDPGTLPAYGQAPPQPPAPQQAAQYSESAAPVADQQVIVVEQPGVYGYRRELPPPHRSSRPATPPPVRITVPIGHPATSSSPRPPQH